MLQKNFIPKTAGQKEDYVSRQNTGYRTQVKLEKFEDWAVWQGDIDTIGKMLYKLINSVIKK